MTLNKFKNIFNQGLKEIGNKRAYEFFKEKVGERLYNFINSKFSSNRFNYINIQIDKSVAI